jgi:tetratricopeptide (TPR) repeat protein
MGECSGSICAEDFLQNAQLQKKFKHMNKNKIITELHEKAMALAEEAFFLDRKKEIKEAKSLYHKAYEIEKSAALHLVMDFEIEPTRSVLFKSAATLALKGNLYREAEKMASFGLAGNPPEEVASELRMVLSNVASFQDKTINNFQELPSDLQKEVIDFIEFLLAKYNKQQNRRLAG